MAPHPRPVRWLASLLALGLAVPGAARATAPHAPATSILYQVNSLADAVPADDFECTLREAIMAANGEVLALD